MQKKYQKIWQLALPYLKAGKRKDFVLHTKEVIQAMEILLKSESGDPEILISAAILHDIGWSKVPVKLQKAKDQKSQHKGLKLHLKYSIPIIKKILKQVSYDQSKTKHIVEIVLAHKFEKPRLQDKRLLIDADTMAEAFKKQFADDCRAYQVSPQALYNFRKRNEFYTQTAQKIFLQELEKRRQEFCRRSK